MDSLKMHSKDITEENIGKISSLFPNCITEATDEQGRLKKKIDFDLLRQELSREIVEGPQERYQLNWPGKRQALLNANSPIAKTLRPCREESVDFDNTQNLFVEGDNLDALKLLQETYLEKVKMIYIDPPYNTGNDFVYNDDFSETSLSYLIKSSQIDEEGNRLIPNTNTHGRFHSCWLSMLYSRLKLARNLLNDKGLIFISIDDNEIVNIRRVLDELFGEDNFVDCIIWKKRYGGGAKEKFLITVHEYVLVYAKNIEKLDNLFIPLTDESIQRYYKLKDENYSIRGPYRTHPLEATKSMGDRANLVFEIQAPDGSKVSPKRQWLWSKERVEIALRNNELAFLKDKNGDWSVHTKQYLQDENGTIRQGKPFSLIDNIYTQHGTNEIIELFGSAQIFSFPKPSKLIYQLIQIACSEDKEALILDFFSGSSSTADAVLQLNAEDKGKRQFIMIQLPERCEFKSEAYKLGYSNIAEIGKERIRRVGKKIKTEHKDKEGIDELDVGFRVLKIDSSSMADVFYTINTVDQDLLTQHTDNVKPDRTSEDLLFQILLDWGVDLTLPITKKTIHNHEVFFVDEDALVACFDSNGKITEEFVKELTQYSPIRVVFRDAGFASDSVKINVAQIFKQLSPHTEVKTI
ncbi:TPA: site-specific DNA-methyltransferase [Legionella pneumophila]|nr:site-specific DNA-methyltransferase [Legionella pneumophila]